jgi:hypothetical protein
MDGGGGGVLNTGTNASFKEIGGCHKLHRKDCIAWNHIVDILMTVCEVRHRTLCQAAVGTPA